MSSGMYGRADAGVVGDAALHAAQQAALHTAALKAREPGGYSDGSPVMASACNARGITVRIEPFGGSGPVPFADRWHAMIGRGHAEGIRIEGSFHDVVRRAERIVSSMETEVYEGTR